jgi:uncharacterized membrane protein
LHTLFSFCFYFILYSFMGWLLESLYGSLREKRPVNRGFLTGPFCPLYGAGALCMIVLSHWVQNVTILLLCAMVLSTALEYGTNCLLERIYKMRFWRYQFLTFRGRISLTTSLIWGILSVTLLDVLHPEVAKLAAGFSLLTLLLVTGVFLLYLASDLTYVSTSLHSLHKRLEVMSKLRKQIQHRHEHIHEMLDDGIQILRDRYESLIQNRAAVHVRLILAYRNMYSLHNHDSLQAIQKAVFEKQRRKPAVQKKP